MEINQRIREFIKTNGLKFTYVAKESNIDMKKFSRMMTGKQKIDTDEYETICSSLRVNPGYFFDQKLLENKNFENAKEVI
ncbi:helix-turn-helix transcriptional regulator [Paenibacillus sp. FSL R7-0312]|uniref:helix-turn-helix transcriptional regulator n=1 Tax=Paenibacillus sp. FSL R7-0312 TaxID=2921682 RepID=UPI0030FC1D0C